MLIFWCLLAMVMLAPLPMGAVFDWAWGGLAVATGALTVGWALGRLVSARPAAIGPAALWPAFLCYGLALAWGWIQAVPWTPVAWHHPLWADGAAALGSAYRGAISLAPDETRAGVMRLATYAGIFWLALQYGRDRGRARIAFTAIAAASGLYAAYGLVTHLSGVEQILWIDKTAYHGSLTSTFVNRNSYAAYAGLGLIATTALLLEAARRIESPGGSWIRTLVLWITGMLASAPWLLLVWTLVAAALLLTGSRGGLAATLLGLGALALTNARAWAHGGARIWPMVVMLMVLAGGLFINSGADVTARLDDSVEAVLDRAQVYALGMTALADRPWLGTGLGTFADIFNLYRDADFDIVFEQAHNSYLENAIELGIPAALLLCAALLLVAIRCAVGGVRRRRDMAYPCAGFGATVLVAAHAVIDFSLHIPAVAATYALLLGVGAAQSWRSGEAPGAASLARNRASSASAA